MCWRIFRYIRHLVHVRHRRGRGIHSPYLFAFVHGVLFNGRQRRVPSRIVEIHREAACDRGRIPAGAAGAGSKVSRATDRTIGSFVRKSSVSEKYGALLYRIAEWFRPDAIVELGAGLGISTLYLASGAPGTTLRTVEGDPVRARYARGLVGRAGLEGVCMHVGTIQEKLEEIAPERDERILAFLDADHRRIPTERYVEKLMERAGEEWVIVIDDIYWSPGMYGAWTHLAALDEVRCSIDLFRMGILLGRSGLQKIDVKINF